MKTLTLATLTFLLSVLTAPATLVRFNMADITGRTNDLPITVQGLVMPFGSSNYVVVGYPQRLQPVGGTITTNLVPGSYRLSVIGPSPAQTLDFSVTNSASVLDVRDLGSYKLSSFTASQYYTSEQSDARYASSASVSNLVSSGITNGQESVSLPLLVTTNGSLRLSGGGYWSELFPTGDVFNVRSLLPATRGVSLVVGDAEGVQNNLFSGSDWSVERVETILVGNADTGQSVAMTLNTNGVIATTGNFHFSDSQSFAAGLNVTGTLSISNGTAGAALYTESGVIKTTNDFESVGTISAANQRWTISSAELNCGFDLAVWNAEDGGMYFSYENLAIGASNTAPWYFSAGGDIKAASVVSSSFTGDGSGLTNLARTNIVASDDSYNTAYGGLSALSVIGAGNSALGYAALQMVTTGYNNTAVGVNALRLNNAENNTAIGVGALETDVFGNHNTAVGVNAGQYTGGVNNTAVGADALRYATNGTHNSAFGVSALRSTTSGSNNTAMGKNAGYSMTTGSYNTALGEQAMASVTTPDSNTGLGAAALFSTATGSENTSVGDRSGYYNVTGSQNTLLGRRAGWGAAKLTHSTAIGYQALNGATGTTNAGNSVFGWKSGFWMTTGGYNTLMGWQSGTNLTTGVSNIVVGAGQSAIGGETGSGTLNLGGVIFGTGLGVTGTNVAGGGRVGILTVAPASALDVNGTATASNFIATAGGRGGLAINGVTNVQEFGASYTAITNWTTAKTGARIGLSTSLGTLTLTNAGTYWVFFQAACLGAGTASVEVAAHHDGVENNTLETSLTFSSSRGSMSFGGHLTTTTNNAVVDVRIKSLSGTETISFLSAQFNAHRILD